MAVTLALTLIGIAVGILVFVVAMGQFATIAGDSQFTCPTDASATGLKKALISACNLVSSFGGAIIIIVAIVGLLVYLRFFR